MWLDKVSTRQILKLRDDFGIREFVETGCKTGSNAIFYSKHFEEVSSCDIDAQAVQIAIRRAYPEKPHPQGTALYASLRDKSDPRKINFVVLDSRKFLQAFVSIYRHEQRNDLPLVLLDAHWYEDWPVLGELHALKDFPSCIVVIHDFKVPNLGYVSYGGQDLDINYVRKALREINPNFCLYTNYREAAEIYTVDEVKSGKTPLINDEYTIDGLTYAWSNPAKTYRGILYAVPQELRPGYDLVRRRDWEDLNG